MKCVVNIDGMIERVSDELAADLILRDPKFYQYCSKKEWKDQILRQKQGEQELHEYNKKDVKLTKNARKKKERRHAKAK
jgi:hypothetical protein